MPISLRHRRLFALPGTARKALLALVAGATAMSMLVPAAFSASSWSPTLLVNTEAFQVIDDQDTASNIQLRFGQTVSETLTWNRTLGVFQFSDDLFVQGTISGSTLNINRNATFAGSGVIITSSGQTVFNEQSRAVDFRVESDGESNMFVVDGSENSIGIRTDLPQATLEVNGVMSGTYVRSTGQTSISSSLHNYILGDISFGKTSAATTKVDVVGVMSGTTVYATQSFSGAGLTSCTGASQKLLWNSTTGRFSCGTDVGGTFGSGNVLTLGDNRYVKKAGDTMTGTLVIQNGNTHTPTLTPVLNVRGTMSGQAIYLSGTGAKTSPLLATDLDFGALLIGTGALKNTGTGMMMPQFSVSGYAQPKLVGSGSATAAPRSSAQQGNYLYVTNASDRLEIFDVSNAQRLLRVGSIALGSGARDVRISGKYAYVANQTSKSLSVVDISDPSAPRLVGSGSFPKSPYNMAFYGQYVYTTGGDDILVMDVSNPERPVYVGSGATAANSSYYLLVQDKYLYLNSTGDNIIVVMDISNPRKPVRIGSTSLGGSAGPMAIQDRYLYAATEGATRLIEIYDISTPASPNRRGTAHLNQSDSVGIAVQGRYAYVLGIDSTNSLNVVDISNPSAPFKIGRLPLGAGIPINLSVQGRYAYAGMSTDKSIQVIDLGGAYVQQLEVGGLATSALTVETNAVVRGNTDVRGALSVGQGMVVNGPSAINNLGTGSYALSIASNTGGLKIAADGNSGAPHLLFGTGITFDTNLFRISANTLHTDDAFSVSGALMLESSLTGATIAGFGLIDCDTASTSKLLWDSSTGRFSCGTDQSGGSFGSGNVLTLGDNRYVKKAGDTMTGALTVNVTGGNQSTLGINVLNTISGAVIRAQKSLASSGTLSVNGAATFGSTIRLNGVTYTFPGGDGAATGRVLTTNGAGQLAWAQLGTGSLKYRTLRIPVPTNTAAITLDKSSNEVNVYVGSETGSTVNPHQYYKVQSGSGQLQDIDIRMKVQLPQNFEDFGTTNDLTFWYRNTGSSSADSKIDILVEDDEGDDAYTASEGETLFNTSWTQFVNEFDGGGFNPVAGEYIYINIKAYASSSGKAYPAEVYITYRGR